jgi:secreted trypsin-like serine protease
LCYVTAAHCFWGKYQTKKTSPSEIFVFAGKFNLSADNERGSRKHSVHDIVIHPDWNLNDDDKYDADIAVVVLQDDVTFGPGIQSVCLPPASFDEVSGTGVVTGWGRTQSSGQSTSDVPIKLEIPAVNASHCYTNEVELANIASNRMFCGGFQQQAKGICNGDSGSGFYQKKSSNWQVLGIVSGSLIDFDHGCDVNKFSLFTNVARFTGWIEKAGKETKENILQNEEVQCKMEKDS